MPPFVRVAAKADLSREGRRITRVGFEDRRRSFGFLVSCVGNLPLEER